MCALCASCAELHRDGALCGSPGAGWVDATGGGRVLHPQAASVHCGSSAVTLGDGPGSWATTEVGSPVRDECMARVKPGGPDLASGTVQRLMV